MERGGSGGGSLAQRGDDRQRRRVANRPRGHRNCRCATQRSDVRFRSLDQSPLPEVTDPHAVRVARGDISEHDAAAGRKEGASYVHDGATDKALEDLRAEYAFAKAERDSGSMSGDLVQMGDDL